MWLYPEVRTLGESIGYHARHDPARLALRTGDRAMTFSEYDRAANRIAHFLLDQGVTAGARVGYLGPNSIDFYLALVGTARTRAAFTVFNWRLAAAELAVLIDDSETGLVFVDRQLAPLWDAASALASRPVAVVLLDGEGALEALAARFPQDSPGQPIAEEDVAVQLYTSGTTGKPKGVMLTHGGFNRIRLCEHLEPAFDWREGDIFLNALPNFHLLAIGIAFQCLYNGVAVSIVRQFEPGLVLAAIARDRPTLLTLTPTMLQMLLDHPDAATTDFRSLRLTLYAGSPISLGLIRRAMARMPGGFMQFYGATEAGGAFSILRPDEHRLDDETTLQSCGRPLPLVAFRIVGEDGREVAEGEVGELLIRAPAITAGYWKQPALTTEVLTQGWYRSGDMARRDARGLYYIVDRRKDMIISGGENIYSAEIETVLSTHPAVAMVAVVGVPDARWGEAVKAVVVPRGDASEGALLAWCRARLAGYKVPKTVDFVAEMPLLASGKVAKRELRARYWPAEGRAIG